MFTALTEEISAQIDKILTDLLEQAEAEAVMLCDRGGNIIAEQSVNEYQAEDNIAALAAGAFFATVEIARLVGESKFRRLLHQGEKTSIYMERLGGDMLLLVVFSKDSNPGLVRLYARTACQELTRFSNALAPQQDGKSDALSSLKLEIDENAQPFTTSARAGSR
jgi:predicted regulator of Ras-like GTPase activity (Roadblock/LC7/MglB family)